MLNEFVKTDAYKAISNQLTEFLSHNALNRNCCLIVISGLPGIGKTSLAMALLTEHLQFYASAASFVLRCDKKENLIRDLCTLAAQLDRSLNNKYLNVMVTIDGSVEINLLREGNGTKQKVDGCQASYVSVKVHEEDIMDEIFSAILANLCQYTPWMILLDNVEVGNGKDFAITVWFKDLLEVLRKCFSGIIVVTSRHRNFLNYLKNNENFTIIHADLEDATYRISYEQAGQIFFGKNDFSGIVDSYGSEQELKDLIERLSFLPLAIKIAGIYVKEEHIKYAQYRQLLKNEAEDIDQIHQIMLHDAPSFVDTELTQGEHTKSVVKTQRSAIQISVNQIVQRTEQSGRENLLLLLNFCAFLDSDNIPLGVVKKFAKKLTKAKALYLDFKNKMSRYSLIQLNIKSLSIHREVHWVIKSYCFKQGTIAERLEALVATSVDTFENCLRSLSTIMPHIASFHTNCNKLTLDNNSRLLLRQSSKTIDDQLNAQVQKRAEEIAEQLENQWSRIPVPDHSVEHQNDDEVKCRADLAAAQISPNFQLPPQNIKFVGRKMQLENLETLFIKYREANNSMVIAVLGSGGIGKSALAIAFIYRSLNKGWYQRTVWFHAEFSHQLLLQVQSLVKQWYNLEVEDIRSLKEEDFIRMFYEYITNKSEDNTCIVLDNAGGLESIETYLPSKYVKTNKVDILITSRNLKWGAGFQGSCVIIPQFSTNEVAKYIQNELSSIKISSAEIDKLTDILGGLPLAVVQAAAYIRQNELDVDSYIELFEKQPVLFAKDDDKNMLTVQHTLTLAIDQVRKKCSAVDPVISICAYLATDHITIDLLCLILDESNKLENDILRIIQGLDPTLSSTRLEHLPQFLKQLRLILRTSNSLEQIGEENKCEEHDRDIYCSTEGCVSNPENASKVFSNSIQLYADNNDITQLQRTLDANDDIQQHEPTSKYQHLTADTAQNINHSSEQIVRSALSTIDNKLKEELLSCSESKLVASRSSVEQALMLLEQYSIVALQTSAIRIHRLTQAVMRNIHKKSGLYQETYQQVIEFLLTQLDYDAKDRNDVNRVSTIIPHSFNLQELDHQFLLEQNPIQLAQLSWKMGRHQLFGVSSPILAIKCYEKTLQIETAHYGETHPDVAATIGNLGTAYGLLGEYGKKRELLSRALDIKEAQFGPSHIQTAITLGSLGNAYGSLGNYEKQRDLLARALVIFEAQFGPNDIQTAVTLSSLGNAYGSLGDYEKQRDLLTRALVIDEAQFGPDHPQTSITLTNLANAYGSLGDYAKQRDLLTRALAIKEVQFGPDHPRMSTTLTNLGNAYGSLGDYEKQRDLLTRALVIDEAQFDPDHPQTSITLTNLANAYGSLGDYETQRDMLTRALAIKLAHFGPDHTETALTLGSLGNAYGSLGDYGKQLDLVTRALAIKEAKFGPNHLQTSITLTSLANAYSSLGDYEKQRDILTRALAILEAQFGPDHIQTSFVLTNLGNAYGLLGDHKKQRDLLIRALACFNVQFGPDHLQTAITMHNLSDAFYNLGDLISAKQYANKALRIFISRFGEQHAYSTKAASQINKINDFLLMILLSSL